MNDNATSDEGGWALVLEFVDGSPSFCNGFSAGQLWQRMQTEADTIETTVLQANREMIVRMCAAKKWHPKFDDLENGWVRATLVPTGRPALSLVP